MRNTHLAMTVAFWHLVSCGSPAAPRNPTGAGGQGGDGGGAGGPAGSGGSTGGRGGGAGTGAGGSPDAASGTGGNAGAAPDAGGGSGSGGGADAANPMPNPATCSDEGPAPAPPTGFRKAEPIDQRFPFSTHFMGIFGANPRCISMTSFSDLDGDGDQDFASGQRDVDCSGSANPNAPMVWWEYCSADKWVKHTVGTGYRSWASGGAGDFDGDGWIDLVAGDSWFKNPGAGVRTAASWMRYSVGAPPNVEEITVGELTGDDRLDVLYVVNSIKPQIWSPGANATMPWTRVAMLPYNQQQGGAIGDLDGDGRNDVLVGDRWWYRASSMWSPMAIPAAPVFAGGGNVNGTAPITWLGDIDGDGDLDIVVQQHWGSRVAWFANADGKGTSWTAHPIVGPGAPFEAKSRGILHGLFAFDFDNDGDIDVFSGENEGSSWIYENMDGKGTFAEHLVAMGPAHEARAADVDCDGDLDIAGKPWGDPGDGAAGRSETIRAHVYFKNELVERGGKPLFVRPKGEVWNVPNKGLCKR